MRTRIVVLTSAFVLLLSTALAVPAAASHLIIVNIVNWNSGQCLAIGGGSMTPAAAAIQWPCGSGLEQKWLVDSQPLVRTTIVNVNSGQCLAIGGAATWPGAGAIQWPCNGGREQSWFWSIYDYPPHDSELRPGHSSGCLAIGGASKAPGTKAIQWTCNGGQEQKWYFINA
jgi:hypothetical protein